MAEYEVVIGLEVHVQLATASKLFCSCSTAFGKAPNSNVCEVCSGMPGSLPVLNAKAVEYAAKAGLATDCTINLSSIFARKNYFYPDLPMGYQISQFDKPICEHGFLEIHTAQGTKKVGITRIHMENDAGKNIHDAHENVSFVDLNRAGTPLVEVVSEPDMRTAEEAVAYLKALHSIVTCLGISDGNMEEGSFRCDANVSLHKAGTPFGTRTELKNLNSFRHVHKAIEYEIARQHDLLEDGESIVQETRLYDSVKNTTHSMRSKEEAHDYRYFPDPDLLPITITEEQFALWRSELPELPKARTARFCEAFHMGQAEAETLCSDRALADFFEQALAAAPTCKPHKVANLILGPLLRELNTSGQSIEHVAMTPAALGELARIIDAGLISAKIANDIFAELLQSGVMPEAWVKEKGLVQISDTSALEKAVDDVIAANPAEVEAYRGGKTKLISFFVGQIMRATKGKANPALVNELLAKKL